MEIWRHKRLVSLKMSVRYFIMSIRQNPELRSCFISDLMFHYRLFKKCFSFLSYKVKLLYLKKIFSDKDSEI